MKDKLIKKIILMVGIIAVLGVASSSAVLSSPASAQKGPGEGQVIGVFGKIPGKDLIVHILVVLPPGADKSEAVSQALRNQGAVPWVRDDFSTTGLVWDQFSDSSSINDYVTQYYNSNNDPTGNGGSALSNTYGSWNGVATSIFEFNDGGTTDRCPSLVRECEGSQYYDGFNDVAWLQLRGCCTLGVTWFSTSIDEADMALNTKFSWSTDGQNNYDVRTVFLHENGHVAGLGHSNVREAVMYASYQQVRQDLHQDDEDGITSLYPGVSNNPPTVQITSPADGDPFVTGATILFEGTASDTEDDDETLTASLVWTSNIDDVIGGGGSFSTTLSDGTHTITAEVTDSGGATTSSSIILTVGTVNSVPTVSITSPADGSNFVLGATILFEGTASDAEDDDLTASLVWESDIDGQIGTGGSFLTTLSDGNHDITATVTDSGGMSGSASVSITLSSTPTSVSVASITYATEGGKYQDKHLLITVSLDNNLGDPVSGASISITLDNTTTGDSWTGTATTGSSGAVTFSLKNAAAGCYTTTVTSINSGLTWVDGSPANEFCK